MIIDLPDTKTHNITKRLRELREERGEVATGRVLTFIVVVNAVGKEEGYLNEVIDSTYEASREHPARVIFLVNHRDVKESRLDGEIRLGGDAGASEIIVMHLNGDLSTHRASVVTPLLLPDTPVVVWWPADAPPQPLLGSHRRPGDPSYHRFFVRRRLGRDLPSSYDLLTWRLGLGMEPDHPLARSLGFFPGPAASRGHSQRAGARS